MDFGSNPRLTIHFYVHSVPFTAAVLNHESSLGGSESAMRVLAEHLAKRGHDVHVFATQLEAPGEYFGVQWHPAETMPDVHRFAAPDVFISLRMPHVFQEPVPAKLRIFWTQDLLIDAGFIGQLYGVDKMVYVSEYHRQQWEGLQPVLAGRGWVTKNPIDPNDMPFKNEGDEIVKVRQRLIHISRPERGLDGVMALWPKIRAKFPDATIGVCRYDSMYDKGGWGAVCADYDRRLEALNAKVGGIVFLGQLNKKELYAEIAQSVGMLYPTTQENFAETNCVAATEAQALGTPIIAARRGALAETVHHEAGELIDGDVLNDESVQDRYIDAVTRLFDSYETPTDFGALDFDSYGRMVSAGIRHARLAYGQVVAQTWESMMLDFFRCRYNANKLGVMRQLLWWDQHEHAARVATDIIKDHIDVAFPEDGFTIPPAVIAAVGEAQDALGLCGRVIRQEEQTADQYAKYAVSDPYLEAKQNGRMHAAADRIVAHLAQLRERGQLRDADGKEREARILDVSCGNGSMAIVLEERMPKDTIIHGVDYSEGVIAIAREACAPFGRRIRFWQGESTFDGLQRFITDRIVGGDLPAATYADGGPYDAVFCGEFIEHIGEPWKLLDALESCVQDEGKVVLSTPCGPFAELLTRGIPRQRGHVHAFTFRDIATMASEKRNFGWTYIGIGDSNRGNACGYWLFGFQPGGGAGQPIDYAHTIMTERPYQRLNVSMIVRDGAEWLRKCLDSLYGVVDRIVIYDTGSVDGSIEIARELGAEVIEGEWPNNFAEARNRSLAEAERNAEWILWIDADEHVNNPERIRRYLTDRPLFNGYVVRQHHLALDQPAFDDKPVRLFKTGRGTKFYGVVHEQPEDTMDAGINPALDQQDFQIVHFGYETEAVRRWKMKARNLPLLMTEITGKGPHPTRKLAWVLYIRDCVNLATWEIERARQATGGAKVLAQRAIGAYVSQGFDDPAHLLHELAWPFYQQALKILGQGVEVAWTFAAQAGKLDLTRVKPKVATFRAANLEEVERLTAFNIKQWTKQLAPVTIDIEPYFVVPGCELPEAKIRSIVRALKTDDDCRMAEWAMYFLQAVTNTGVDVPVLDLGGRNVALMAELLKALERDTPIVSVAPSIGVAGVANHYHYPMHEQRFLSPTLNKERLLEHQGRSLDLDLFAFAVIDGGNNAAVSRLLDGLMGRLRFGQPMVAPGGVVIINDVTMSAAAILAHTGAEIREAKFGQQYAVIRMPGVPAVQTSATSEAVA